MEPRAAVGDSIAAPGVTLHTGIQGPTAPRPARRADLPRAPRAGPRDHQRGRRQLRYAQRHLPGLVSAGPRRARPAGEVDVQPPRGLSATSRPRQRDHRRAGARRDGRFLAAGRAQGGHRRLPRRSRAPRPTTWAAWPAYTTPTITSTPACTNNTPTGPPRGRPAGATYATSASSTWPHATRSTRSSCTRNLIPASAMPFKTGLVFTYDCGGSKRSMTMALTQSDRAG